MSPAVADVPRLNVFTVAEDYFPGIEAELAARISADTFYSQNTFDVPQGYFESLETSILEKIRAQENTLAENVSGSSSILAAISNVNIFTVPQEYFDGLEKSILQKIRAEENISVNEEMNALSPLIAGIGKENIFTVPAGYFAQPGFKETPAPAKVVQMNPARSRSIFRYAAAAVITGLLGISIINITSKEQHIKDPVGATAAVSNNNIQTLTNDIVKTGSFDKELASLSDDDIDQYLKQDGQDVDAAKVAASANDDSKLPNAVDYLLNDNTLDDYLKENNLKN